MSELTPRTIERYGWRPDTPDQRDHLMAVEPSRTLPPSISLRGEMPPVYDQGQLGSCTGNGVAGVLEHAESKKGGPVATPSRLFIYYGERVIEHTVSEDAGAEIRDGIKVVAKLGAPDETLWPYDISKFAHKPSERAYRDAKKHEALAYARVPQTAAAIQTVLAGDQPIVFGFSVYQSFESDEVAQSGIVPMPAPGEAGIGGHAVVAVGYKQINGVLYTEVRNSWGEGWGDHGYFWMPMGYVTSPSLASDFWVITGVR